MDILLLKIAPVATGAADTTERVILLLKTKAADTATAVIENNTYYSSGKPRMDLDKIAEIWVINKVANGELELKGRYKRISNITSTSSISEEFTQGNTGASWKYKWQLEGFIDKNGNVITSNISEYNNTWIKLTDLKDASKKAHIQTMGYVKLDTEELPLYVKNIEL